MDKRFGPTLVLILVIFFILVYAGSLVTVFIKEGLGGLLDPDFVNRSPGDHHCIDKRLYRTHQRDR